MLLVKKLREIPILNIGVRRETLRALVKLGDSGGKETAVKWLTNEEIKGVKDLAIRCIKLMNLKEYIPDIRLCLKTSDEIIQISAIVALSQWGDEESRPAFEKASRSKAIRRKRAGATALKKLDKISTKNN